MRERFRVTEAEHSCCFAGRVSDHSKDERFGDVIAEFSDMEAAESYALLLNRAAAVFGASGANGNGKVIT